jgi:hypothetical protein
MTWLKAVGVAVVTALAAMVGAGLVASLAVGWYRISSFEGGSGFFVVGLALLGLLGGFVIGLVAAVALGVRGRRGFGHTLGFSTGAIAVILALAGGVSWLLADIPPEIDGEELYLLTEIRWPAGTELPPAQAADAPYLYLGAMSGDTLRTSQNGPLFLEDARQEDGRWIVPGALPVFTSRGRRLLGLTTREKSIAAFIVPLPGRPGTAEREWSGWLPSPPSESPEPPNRFTYRYKVIKRSEPVRSEKIGAFEIDTIADYFHNVSGTDRLAARGTFHIRYAGQLVREVPSADTAAVVSPGDALLVTIENPEDDTRCALLIPADAHVRFERVKGCGTPLTARVLTADTSRFAAARRFEPLPGWVDRTVFAKPGLFQLHAAILDTRSLTSATFLFPEDNGPNTSVPPLSLSPDEQSFVWLAQGFEEKPQLGVTNWRTNRSYMLPIDRARMRFNAESSFTPDWVAHHFEWQRGPDGYDVLVERAGFVPMPHRGDLTVGRRGEYQAYTLRPGSAGLRDAVIEVLARDLGGELLPEELAGYRRIRVQGKVLTASLVESPDYVSLTMDMDGSDPRIMSAVGAALDAAFATGRYDALFVSKSP